jgi:hypothetical protein
VVRTERLPVGFGRYGDGGLVAPCYSGPAQDLSLVVSVMEHDESDPDTYRREVESVARGGAGAAAAAGYPVPKWAVKILADLVNADLGDDNLGQVALSFSRDELLAEADKPRLDEGGVTYTRCTMHHGDGSTYKAYFDVVRGGGAER